jgi:regulatory protein
VPAESEDRAPGGLAAGQFPGAAEELARQEAFDVAWRFLGHRDRTEAEVRRNFTRKRVEPALVEEVVSALLEGNYLDDAAFARRFAEDRRNLDGWGSERIERRLAELGVERELIRAALAAGGGGDDEGGAHDELGAACELLARRFPIPPDNPRDRDRALGFLVRKGYELELAHDALRRHAAAAVEN